MFSNRNGGESGTRNFMFQNKFMFLCFFVFFFVQFQDEKQETEAKKSHLKCVRTRHFIRKRLLMVVTLRCSWTEGASTRNSMISHVANKTCFNLALNYSLLCKKCFLFTHYGVKLGFVRMLSRKKFLFFLFQLS